MRVIEGGACCGYHALNIARAVGPEGKVYCFEANPNLVDILRRNLEVNGYRDNTEVFQMGLWKQECVLPFPLLGGGLGGASFKNSLQLSRAPTVPVKMVSLDSMFSGQKINFIRMDIEGAEIDALEGASRMLASQRPMIIMEWIPADYRAAECEEFYGFLREPGYRVYRITSEGLVGVRNCAALNSELVSLDDRDILCRVE
jgi:FkbM family methyltransferase